MHRAWCTSWPGAPVCPCPCTLYPRAYTHRGISAWSGILYIHFQGVFAKYLEIYHCFGGIFTNFWQFWPVIWSWQAWTEAFGLEKYHKMCYFWQFWPDWLVTRLFCQITGLPLRVYGQKTVYFGHFGQNCQKCPLILIARGQKCQNWHFFTPKPGIFPLSKRTTLFLLYEVEWVWGSSKRVILALLARVMRRKYGTFDGNLLNLG